MKTQNTQNLGRLQAAQEKLQSLLNTFDHGFVVTDENDIKKHGRLSGQAPLGGVSRVGHGHTGEHETRFNVTQGKRFEKLGRGYVYRSLVPPSETTKKVDRSDRVAVRNPLLRNLLVRGGPRVVFDPPVLPFVRCAHTSLPDPATTSAPKHHLQALQTSAPTQIETFVLVLAVPSISPKFSSVKLRYVFCKVVLSTCLQVRATVGKQLMCTCRAGGVPELDEHD